MHGVLVAIDLESTGLDPMQDEIIEVGAVRMENGEITDEFSTFVDPGIPIPDQITHITGIRKEDVIGAPNIQQVLPQIAAFTGNAPVIAHYVSMDMGFLQQRHGILKRNQRLDTYELASILLPRAARYNLNSLTTEVGISLENAHRALDDARATALLYWELWKKLLELPIDVLKEIVFLSESIPWDEAVVFRAALAQHDVTSTSSNRPIHAVFEPMVNVPKPLVPSEAVHPVPTDEITNILGEGGILSQSLNHFEYRNQQIEMAGAVTDALNKGQHLIVEAGTGTGKSLAYLVPSVLWSVQNDLPVVVSTNTINLQDQLINNDIPILEKALGIDIRATVLKGRGNYLCPQRLNAVRRRRPTSLAELRTLAKVLVWLLDTTTGDRGEISLRGPVENAVWHRLSAEDEGCTLNRCHASMLGACPFYKSRKAADAAHIIIVNHALLISDSVSENHILPKFRHVIVDEAHHLEDAVTYGMTLRVDHSELIRRLADLGGPNRGFLGELLYNARQAIPDKEVMKLEMFIQAIDEATSAMQAYINRFYQVLGRFVSDVMKPSDNSPMLRITADMRRRPSFSGVQNEWQALAEFFEVLSISMRRLTKALKKLEDYRMNRHDDLLFSTETAADYFQKAMENLHAFVSEPDPENIYWVGLGQISGDLPSINVAPLHVGKLVEENLWHSKSSVILTSATLRTGDDFQFVKNRLFAENVKTLDVGSPFNYEASTLLYLPQDIPEPNDRVGYQRAIERSIIEMAAALNGRVLVLFTSYAQLRQTSQSITSRLALGGINVYDQSDGTSRQALVDGFKTSEKAVLLGTRSFWEGVDIPGESLSGLIITRLPFAVPSDPIFASRSDTYNDSFNDYAVPEAILRFRQGFGRLIRRQTDRGVVTVIDRRIISKRYGMRFLESLPNCTIQYGNLDELGQATKKWLKQ